MSVGASGEEVFGGWIDVGVLGGGWIRVGVGRFEGVGLMS